MLTTRPAQTSDYSLFLSLNREIQALHAQAEPELFKPADQMNLSEEDFNKMISDNNNLIVFAESEGVACGYVYAEILDRKENSYRYGLKLMYIDQLGVSAKNRGQGIGKYLLNHIVSVAKSKQIHRIEVDCWTFNEEAIGFYSKFGFKTFNEKFCIKC